MTLAVSWNQAEATRHAGESLSGNGTKLYRCDYFGPLGRFFGMAKEERLALHERALAEPASPHGFMIQQSANSEILAHFHRVPQYQIIVHGGGRLGRNAVDAVSFHYTDEYTAYGPIRSADDGIWYFTLRGYFDPGANYVGSPDARALIRPSAKRFLLVGPDKVRSSPPAALAARTSPALDCVIEAHADGVAAWMLRLGPDMQHAGPDPSPGGGQYYAVLAGSLVHGGVAYPRHSLFWVDANEPAFDARAGAEGAECAILQFPRAFNSRAKH